eukprot:CAMPEP_0197591168 /NCGR_PEP_ID=MMETSP1326-20131121/12914_1 /TAXON_ID=1155430 /ORGANISM="Genus nov. species nov., Strain RCC2288" /LENGTH=125 /DNA_ID=CAMNT_0043156539 /DNA_START=20 /DNA_END=397 /DNA_ORIENTATION=-
MASYLTKVTGIASKAAEVVKTKVVPSAVKAYNATMAGGAEFVVKDPAAADKLGRQLVYTNLAKLPVMIEGAAAEIKVVERKWAGRMDLPMMEVGVAALFSAEVYAWMCVGEIIGSGGGAMSGYYY